MASSLSTSPVDLEENGHSSRECNREAVVKLSSAPGAPCKPLAAAKPSRRPAPPPPPPKPQPLNVACNSSRNPTLDSESHEDKEASINSKLKNGLGKEEGSATTAKPKKNEGAGLGTGPPPRPPLPTSPPPLQRKGPFSPSSSASLPASFRSEQSRLTQKQSASQIKPSPSLHSVPTHPQSPLNQSSPRKDEVNGSSSPQVKTSPPKAPKPPVPPKVAPKFKKKNPIPNVENVPTRQSNDAHPTHPEETLQRDQTDFSHTQASVDTVHNQDVSSYDQNKSYNESSPSPGSPTPDFEQPSSTPPSSSRCEQTPSFPKLLETSPPSVVNPTDSWRQEADHQKKTAPPPLPKNPPRGGLPRKPRSTVGKKPPERPAPPKPCTEAGPAVDQSKEVSNLEQGENGDKADLTDELRECVDEADIGSTSAPACLQTHGKLKGPDSEETTQVSQTQRTPPKPRPRTRLSIPSKLPEGEGESFAVSSGSSANDTDESRLNECVENSRVVSQGDTAEHGEGVKSAGTENLLKTCPGKSLIQHDPELDYVEVYRGEDGQKHRETVNSAIETELDSHKAPDEGLVSGSVSHENLGVDNIDTREPESTCGMLKELEDLLNKKLEDLDQNELGKESPDRDDNQSLNLNATDIEFSSEHSGSLSSSPVRPPRPKHQASLARRQSSVDSLTTLSQSGSCESLTSTGTLKKVGPPKPKRTSLPRVSRSHSDASELRSPTDSEPDSEGLGWRNSPQLQSGGKPYLPPRLESLRKNCSLTSSSDSPPPLPPRNRSNTSFESTSVQEEPPPLPERVSLAKPFEKLQNNNSDDSCQKPVGPKNEEDMKGYRNSCPPRPAPPCPAASDTPGALKPGGAPERANSSPAHKSPMPRPTRKAPPPPATAPRRSATFGPGDAASLTVSEPSENHADKDTSSTEEPDYHEIPAEGLLRTDESPAPKLPPRVARSKSVGGTHDIALELPPKDGAGLRRKVKKSASLERDASLKPKLKKDEQLLRERKTKTALIHRVTQGIGQVFRKSKSPESTSSKTSDSCDSSELEVDDSSKSKSSVDESTAEHPRKGSKRQVENTALSSGSSKDAAEGSVCNEKPASDRGTSKITDPVTVDIVVSESDHTEDKVVELPSPAMEQLGMGDLESEVMSALKSGMANAGSSNSSPAPSQGAEKLYSPVASKERPESFRSNRSTSTSSEREPGEEAHDDQEGEALSSASDSEPEPEQDKEEIYAIRKAKKVFFIAKEIESSEGGFVDVLKLLNVDFRVHISEATEKHGQPIIPSEMLNKILDYLPQLQNFNENLLKDLSDRIQQWEENPRIADIFVKKGPFLKLYSSYIRNFENSTATLDEATKRFPQFAVALKEFEMSPRCASLYLKHYMLKPIQRIPQYKLLLQDYLKQLSPASADFKDTLTALNIVSEVADHANESMRHGDNVQKLLEIQRSLVGSFEVIQPGRVLVMQGELEKVSRKEMQPRMFFLFSDVLLYTTPVTTGNKINNILPLIGMKVISPKLEDHENEFNIISVQRSFTLCASTPYLKQQWVEALQKAIEENAKRHNTFEAVKQGPETSLHDKDFVLGHKAPLWVPDARVTMCMLCLVEFTLTYRRHHCRSCGRIICGQCSQNKAPLRYLKYKPSRVCDECFNKLKEDFTREAGIEKNTKKKRSSLTAEEESSTSVTDDGTSTSSHARDDADGPRAEQAAGTGDAGEQHDSGLSLHSLLGRFTKIRSSNNRKQRKQGNKRPTVLMEVHAIDEGSDMSGYLHTFKSRKWKKMWFVVKGKVLYTYKASADMAAVESMPLLGYEVLEFESVFEGVEPSLLIGIRHQNNQPLTSRSPAGGALASRGMTGADRAMQGLVLKTDSAAATSKWLTVLREATLT